MVSFKKLSLKLPHSKNLTESQALDKGEVRGSSPPRPTSNIDFHSKKLFLNLSAKGRLCLRSLKEPFEPEPYNDGGGIA